MNILVKTEGKEMNRNIRTDLAIELREEIKERQDIEGINIRTTVNEDQDIRTTVIDVINDEGVRRLGKPVGTYITIESESIRGYDEGIHMPLCQELSRQLEKLLDGAKSILVAGLGNRAVTPDSLGPLVVDHLFITRHLKPYNPECKRIISGISPGVMAQTGIETVEIIQGICEKIHVDAVIAIDALAARSSKRLNRTIQLTDTGISPGSGVGNHRKAVDFETIGVKVIALGVPTVISVPSIVDDSMDIIADAFNESYGKAVMETFSEEQRYALACNMVEPDLVDMFVTPKNIDELVKRISYTISEAINSMNS